MSFGSRAFRTWNAPTAHADAVSKPKNTFIAEAIFRKILP